MLVSPPRFLGLIGPVVGHESRHQDRDEIPMDGREIRTPMDHRAPAAVYTVGANWGGRAGRGHRPDPRP
ncbi:MAG TPA: hypothetical protein VLB12_14790, partial [Gemmatimonadales bacterium]|nr:hypothetical protein [Gemmatimonadales bacterium]